MLCGIFSPYADLKRVLCGDTDPSDSGRLAPLDGARCLALLWVFALHSFRSTYANLYTGESHADPKLQQNVLAQWWSQIAIQGNTGVDAFFVLSGMLVSSVYVRVDGPRLCCGAHPALFLLRRFWRIWPMVVAAVLAAFAMAAGIPDFAKNWQPDLAWPYLILMPNFFEGSLGITGIGHLWSVSVEMQMYLLTPFLCELLFDRSRGRRRPWALAALGGLSLASVALRAWWVFGPPKMMTTGWWPPPPLYTNVFGRCSPYLSGMALHLVLQEHAAGATASPGRASPLVSLAMAAADLLSLALLALAGLVGHHYSSGPSFMNTFLQDFGEQLVVVLWSPLFGWVLARCLFRTLTAEAPAKDSSLFEHFRPWYWCQCFLSCHFWLRLALLSYSAYVVQFITPWPLAFLDQGLNLTWSGLAPHDTLAAMLRAVIQFALWTLLSCLIALPFHLLVEAPGMRFGRVLDRTLRARLAPAAKGSTCAETPSVCESASGSSDAVAAQV